MSRITHCLDSRLTDGGEVVSLNHELRFTSQKHFYSFFGYLFLLEAEEIPGPSEAGRIRQTDKSQLPHQVWNPVLSDL
jgi:hypothetical protein